MTVSTIVSANLRIAVYTPAYGYYTFIDLIAELGGVHAGVLVGKLVSTTSDALSSAKYDERPTLNIFNVDAAYIGDYQNVRQNVSLLVKTDRRFVLFVSTGSQDYDSEQLLAELSDLSEAVDVVVGRDKVAARLSDVQGKFSRWIHQGNRMHWYGRRSSRKD